MAINTLATATLFMTQLDKIAVQEATTGWMDANAGQVIYNGGSEVKIPKMSVQGMGDYDREAGYQRGSVTLEYETRKMTQDRGRLFQLDPMDINEANFIPTAGAVMGEFQRTQVVPEIDAYRISKLATETLTADKAGMIGESYVPGTASTSALRKLKEGIKAVRENYNGALICQATPDFIMELELELAGKITAVTFSKGGIQTQVPSVDGVPLVSTPSNRMYTAIKINNGKDSGQEKGGYEKGTSAKNLNFFICPVTTPIAVTKKMTVKKDKEGSTSEEYGTASSVTGESWPASGKVQAEQYGQRLNYIRNIRIQGSYKIQTDEKGRLHYILEDGTDIEERDGICLYVAADQLPDYRIISIKPYRFLTMEVEKI